MVCGLCPVPASAAGEMFKQQYSALLEGVLHVHTSVCVRARCTRVENGDGGGLGREAGGAMLGLGGRDL